MAADYKDLLMLCDFSEDELLEQSARIDKAFQKLELGPKDMDRAIADSDLDAWADADDRFHAELVRLGGNSRIQTIVGMMSDQVRRARMTTLFMRPLPTKSNEDHRLVYQAIRDGDAAMS